MEPDQPGVSALEHLIAWLAERSAALPPLPGELLAAVRQRAPEWWETSSLDLVRGDPTDTAVAEGASGALDHFLLVGRSGRGYASYFFHVVVAEGPLVVVARLLAPTAFEDELATPSLSGVLRAIGPLAQAAEAARERGLLGDADRVLVIDDERSGRFQHGTARHGVVADWHSASPATLFESAAIALTADKGHDVS